MSLGLGQRASGQFGTVGLVVPERPLRALTAHVTKPSKLTVQACAVGTLHYGISDTGRMAKKPQQATPAWLLQTRDIFILI